MTHKTYPKYKDSGDDWIGDVPKGWEKRKIAHLFQDIGSGGTPKSSEEEYYLNGTIPWVNTGDLNDAYLYEVKNFITEKALNDVSTLKFYPENSLIVAMYGATIGKLAITKLEAVTNQACCVLANPNNTSIKYMYYWFIANRSHIIHLGSGGGQPNISQGIIKSLEVHLPQDIQEQVKIIGFLDKKVKETSDIIQLKEEQIKLLQEKRQAVITEAVSKGLNSNVSMKDSSVEWIGNVPSHWTTSRLDFISRVKARLGWKGLKADEYVDEGYILLSTPNLRGREIEFDNVNYITEERYLESPEIMLEVGDVLLVKDGSTLGITNVVRELPQEATVNSSTAVIRPTNQVDSIYLYYYLTSTYIQDIVNQVKDGMGVPHLFQSDINKFKVLLPPLSEQIQIGQFLDKSTYQVEQTIESIQIQIKMLKEYRDTLIFEAVTGKIDLRDYKGGEYDGD